MHQGRDASSNRATRGRIVNKTKRISIIIEIEACNDMNFLVLPYDAAYRSKLFLKVNLRKINNHSVYRNF